MLMTGLTLLAVAAAPLKVAATRLNVVDLTEARADFYTEHFAGRLADQGIEVTTPREIATILGLERQRQLLGCEEQLGCLAEIAGALGVDGVALGDVARVGAGFQLNLKILSPQTGKRVAFFSAQAKTEDELVDTLTRAAQVMSRQLAEAFGRPLSPLVTVAQPLPAASSSGARSYWWIPAVVGVGSGIAGAVGLANAEAARARLGAGTFELTEAQQLFRDADTARTLGFVGLGVGVAALGTAAGLLLFGADAPVSPAAMISADGAHLVLTGALP